VRGSRHRHDVGSTRAYALPRRDGMDETVALLMAIGLMVGASLVLLREERGPRAPGTA
jgi:hypothetical protein